MFDLDSRGEILWVMVERHVITYITYMVWLVVSTPLKNDGVRQLR